LDITLELLLDIVIGFIHQPFYWVACNNKDQLSLSIQSLIPASLTESATLVLICKRPALHYGKQRLAHSIGAEHALVFARHFLACALEDLNTWPGRIVISPADQQDTEWASQLLSKDTLVMAQSDGNLGERINNLDLKLRARGHQQLIYIGSDAPILSMHHYQQINQALTEHAIALCPARDGGVTIMANAQPWPDLRALPWSTAQLGDSLVALCQTNDLSVHHTEMTYDIDCQPELLMLGQDLAQDSRPARQTLVKEINLLQSNTI
jgi:glycosyltransferase A (GT-A) superfamily protein (DUF2064 family)